MALLKPIISKAVNRHRNRWKLRKKSNLSFRMKFGRALHSHQKKIKCWSQQAPISINTLRKCAINSSVAMQTPPNGMTMWKRSRGCGLMNYLMFIKKPMNGMKIINRSNRCSSKSVGPFANRYPPSLYLTNHYMYQLLYAAREDSHQWPFNRRKKV